MMSLINPNHPTIQALVERGYRLAAHEYLKASGKVQVTFSAKHPETGKYIQGGTREGRPLTPFVISPRMPRKSKRPSR